MKESIMQSEKECYICKTTQNLERHHCIGGSYRKTADVEGLWVYLCNNHHTGQNGVHRNPLMIKELQTEAQKAWLKDTTMQAWMKRFGKSFL